MADLQENVVVEQPGGNIPAPQAPAVPENQEHAQPQAAQGAYPILQNVPFPNKLDFKDPHSIKEDWEMFSQIWNNYEICSGLVNHTKQVRTATLLTCFQPSALKIYNSLGMSAEEKTDIDVVLRRMEEHCRGVVNQTYERYKFNTRTQAPHESVDDFYVALLELSKNCSYGNLEASLIRDRLVVGIKDNACRKKLIQEKNLTLQRCLDIVRSTEAATAHMSAMQGPAVNRIKQKQPVKKTNVTTPKPMPKPTPKPPQKHQKSRYKQQNSSTSCYFCGGDRHPRPKCPAKDFRCTKCGKWGHFPDVCQSTKGVREVVEEEDEAFLGSLQSENQHSHTGMTKVTVDDTSITFRIDSGADVDVIPYTVYTQHYKHKVIMPSGKVLRGPDGSSALQNLGYIKCKLHHETTGITIMSDVYVLKSGQECLLSRKSSVALGVLAFLANINVEDEYQHLFTGLGEMAQPYNIELEPDAAPFAISTPRRVALPLLPKVKDELDKLQELGVIRPVTEPTEWCAPIVVVPKTNGGVRLCVDYTQLNKSVKRERYILPSVEEILGQMAGATVFSKLDANAGFHQIKLTPQSQLLTTFISPFGRFCYNRVPMGINSAPEHYQRQVHQVLDHQVGAVCIADDIIVFGRGTAQHDEHLDQTLKKLSDANVTLNKQKCEFRKTEISVVGHVVGKYGVKADPDKIRAIQDLPQPTNLTELRSFLGMVNQLGKFLPDLSAITEPLRSLLSSKTTWHWDQAQSQAFMKVKELVSHTPVLALYDPNRQTKVSADSSSYGLGAVLLQLGDDQNWHPVCFASRSLSETESRYAQVEKEALASTYACEKFSKYLTGLAVFTLETDHKPLIALLGSKALDELPPRIQRMRMRLMRFTYNIVHVPGRHMYTADFLSRSPLGKPSDSDEQMAREITLNVCQIMANLPATDKRIEEIRLHQQEDEVCQQLLSYLETGWPEKWQVKGAISHYWSHQGDIYQENGILMYKQRIIIPSSMRLEILDRIHEGHQGITKCRRRATTSVWWPGISRQVEDLVKNCRTCIQETKQRPEPLEPSEVPHRPWEKVATDLFELNGRPYLLVVDYYSRFIEVANLENGTTSACVINHMKSIFSNHGIPDVVVSDNGPQYACHDFTEFSQDYGFHHVTSSPRHPQGNGMAERAVQTVKNLLKTAKDPYAAMLAYRATPLACGYSPAELLNGRKLRTKLPVNPKNLEPILPDKKIVQEKEELHKWQMKLNFDRAHRAYRPLPVLEQGARVYLPDRKEEGQVTTKLSPRSYSVATPSGTFRRNRSHLNQLPTTSSDQSPPAPSVVQVKPPPAVQRKPSEPVQPKSPKPVQDKHPKPVQRKPPETMQAANTDQVSTTPGTVKKTRSGRAVIIPAKYR